MSLPNLSFLGSVGQLRYLQARFESGGFRNPDTAVGAFLSPRQRLSAIARGVFFRPRMRSNPFYYYLLARTLYYDEVFATAARGSVRAIVNIGCGTDTRAHRFRELLREHRVRVVECDQPMVIERKQRTARAHWTDDHVTYVPLDLNVVAPDALEQAVRGWASEPVLIMLEGVSPYVVKERFLTFLRTVARSAAPGSVLAYDYKLTTAPAEFGRTASVQEPFRLTPDDAAVRAMHTELGLRVDHLETGRDLIRRLLPEVNATFSEDALVRLGIGG